MAEHYGKAIWQCHKAKPYGKALWQGHMATPNCFVMGPGTWDQGHGTKDMGPGTDSERVQKGSPECCFGLVFKCHHHE